MVLRSYVNNNKYDAYSITLFFRQMIKALKIKKINKKKKECLNKCKCLLVTFLQSVWSKENGMKNCRMILEAMFQSTNCNIAERTTMTTKTYLISNYFKHLLFIHAEKKI